ncbi:MAG: M23 family metallopeptidase [Ardenticatenaceae bacterium]|nr:M23 family metallopeptidase [Ardenticatenaceae bacterium]
MSLNDLGSLLFPQWLRDWLQYQFLPALGFTPYQLTQGLFRGIFDALMFIFIALGLLSGGRSYMAREYKLSSDVQNQVLKWAVVSDQIGRQEDVPREVPLVIWFKESGMRAENPTLCTGIIGAYDLVQSGERPCFEPGPINDLEIRAQLSIAAQEFKKRCPEITYLTQDASLIKKCYFAYNAGVSAAERLDPNQSAYVMNGFDEAHQNMLYQDIVLGSVRVTQLGAWPTHIAMQSLIVGSIDDQERPFSIALLDSFNRISDWLNYRFQNPNIGSPVTMAFPDQRFIASQSCVMADSDLFKGFLAPSLNPVTASPILTQDLHGCEYGLPGVDISSQDRRALLQAPMPGKLTTYTDQWYNTTIRIENSDWVVWMLHPRSYLVISGEVDRGQAVGVMGAVGIATGPHVHYTVYDKQEERFVDPAILIP